MAFDKSWKKNCVYFTYSGFYKNMPDRCRLRELKPKCCDKIPAEDEEFAENPIQLQSLDVCLSGKTRNLNQ